MDDYLKINLIKFVYDLQAATKSQHLVCPHKQVIGYGSPTKLYELFHEIPQFMSLEDFL